VEEDSQVKLRGIRIELNEISEAILQTARGTLSQAVIGIRGSEGHAQFLVAFVVFSLGQEQENANEYLEGLLQQLPLPIYMRPAQAVPLSSLPMNASGKLDKTALRNIPLPARESSSRDSEELTHTEKKLVEIWEVILDRTGIQITKTTSFFAAGGNSLLLLRLQAEIRKGFSVDVALPDLFRMNTLQDLARLVQSNSDLEEGGLSVPAAGGDNESIDWAAASTLPDFITELARAIPSIPSTLIPARKGITVMMTGATGFLGRHILHALNAQPEISQIHCLAVRNPTSQIVRDLEASCYKAVFYPGDLRLPRLGLAEDEARLLFADAHAIVHNGADVSFMKPYAALEAPNVGSTVELVRLSLEAGGHASMHFVSTAGVAAVLSAATARNRAGTEDANFVVPASSLAHTSPKGNSLIDGYVASKWTSEALLQQVATAFEGTAKRVVRIYRPSSITGEGAPALDIMHNVLNFSRRLRAVPEMRGWKGWFDFVSVERVARGLVDGVLSTAGIEGIAISASPMKSRKEKGADFVHLSGEEIIAIDEAKGYMEKETGYEFRQLDMVQWVKEAVGQGLHPLVAAYLESISLTDINAEGSRDLWFPKLHSDLHEKECH
jgi:nucleoside-diphosphate-sugar epimerase/acyl carrier protein